MNHDVGQHILVPDGTLVHPIPKEDFKKVMNLYAGITAENYAEVAAKLTELGISEGQGKLLKSAVQPMDTRAHGKRAAEAPPG